MVAGGYNLLAIGVATLVAIVIGMVWYAPPVFGRRWQRHMGISKPGAVAGAVWAVCYASLGFTLVYLFKHIGVSGAQDGFRWGATLGLSVAAMAVAPNYAFGRRALSLFAIEMGYVVVALSVMGMILAEWR